MHFLAVLLAAASILAPVAASAAPVTRLITFNSSAATYISGSPELSITQPVFFNISLLYDIEEARRDSRNITPVYGIGFIAVGTDRTYTIDPSNVSSSIRFATFEEYPLDSQIGDPILIVAGRYGRGSFLFNVSLKNDDVGSITRGANLFFENYFDKSGFYGYADRGFASFSAVPEPATWAMMIGGVGMIGGSLRRRRSTVRSAIA